MKQILNKKGVVEVEELPAPTPRDGFLVVSSVCSLISSGTELASLQSSSENLLSKALKNPDLLKKVITKARQAGIKSTTSIVQEGLESLKVSALGYSTAGVVIGKEGDTGNIEVGDRVACAGAGYASHAEVVCVPKNLVVKIPENVGFDEAAFTTLGAIAMQGIRRANPTFGETVVVVGLGLLGQLAVQILKAAGCKVVGVDLVWDRVELAKKNGLDKGVTGNAVEEILAYTNHVGADAAIICAATESSEPVNQAMQYVRKKGRIVVVGDVGMNVNRKDFYRKEIDFLISTSYGPGRYDQQYEEKGLDYPIAYVRWTENRNMQEFLRLVSEKKINVKSLVSKEYSLENAPQAYADLQSKKDSSLAVLIKYSQTEDKKTSLKLNPKTVSREKINVALIGAGGFAKSQHLPNIKKSELYNLRWIVDADSINTKQTAERYGSEYCGTDYHEALDDKDVDMILISTRHNLHAKIAIEAAKKGKHVLVEKPMAMNYDELNEVLKAVKNGGVHYTVGFNRRYSSLSQRMRQYLGGKMGPYMIVYRVNAGYLPKEHWTNDPVEGGGRIIGEGCHFFDYFNWLTDSEPVTVYAESINTQQEDTTNEDNIIATVKYADGSLATLIYNTIGSKSLPKERVEVYRGGSVAVIDDYTSLMLDGKETKLRDADKGHNEEITQFARKIKGENSISLDLYDAVETTAVTLKALDSLRAKKPLQIDSREYVN